MDYVIKKIEPKNGVMRDIHERILGCRCSIIVAEPTHPGILKYEPRDERGVFHAISTSPIVSVSGLEDGAEVIIETNRTVYSLERIDSVTVFCKNQPLLTLFEPRKK